MWEIRDRSVVTSSVIPSAKYCWSGSLLRLAKGNTTIDRRGATSCGADAATGAPAGGELGAGTGLDELLAQIVEHVGQLVVNLIAHGVRYADAARLGQRLQPGRDIHPVAENVSAIDDDVAEIDANAKSDAPLVGYIPIAVEDDALNLCGAAHRVDDAAK